MLVEFKAAPAPVTAANDMRGGAQLAGRRPLDGTDRCHLASAVASIFFASSSGMIAPLS
jgi:hypothetical protein